MTLSSVGPVARGPAPAGAIRLCWLAALLALLLIALLTALLPTQPGLHRRNGTLAGPRVAAEKVLCSPI